MSTSSQGPRGDRVVAIGDLTIHDVSFAETVARILDWAEARAGRTVCTPNVDYVVRAHGDPLFRSAIQSADLRVPDGMWIVYASWIAGRPLTGSVTGRLLLPAIAARAAGRGLRLALFGASDGVAQEVGRRLTGRHAGLQVVAAVSPPTPFVIGSDADEEAVDAIASANPDVLFVALGAPKQELWMRKHAGRFGGAAIIGVGAAFDIVAGRFREAPRWMTRIGLEWLFRLAQEPRRLARRYLVDDPWIVWWALRTRVYTRRHTSRRP
jgi:N-acetylglucosaminyldiphosphoundecaprenol N-acetyl-beta-D-mannosaminyltransferase